MRNILLSALVYTKRVELSVLDNLHLKVVELCSQYGVIYIVNRNIYGIHLYQDNLHLLHSGKRILLDNFISKLNFLPETQVRNTFYLDTEKENSDFHREILVKDFDLGIFENSDDSINISYLNPLFQIKKMRTKNPERVIIGNLNINSLTNKFE